jgi:RNA polymerase sigma-70 factor (ECF subfamily)
MTNDALDFRQVFERELPFVLRALRRLGVRQADLSDVAQELFVSVHDRLGEVRASSSIRPWLSAFCVRFAANYRRLARHRGESLDEAVVPAQRGFDDAAQARDLVLRALDHLDFEQRTALVLHDLEGLGAPDIAELTGVPLNTVYSRIRLARNQFRAQVARLTGEGGS